MSGRSCGKGLVRTEDHQRHSLILRDREGARNPAVGATRELCVYIYACLRVCMSEAFSTPAAAKSSVCSPQLWGLAAEPSSSSAPLDPQSHSAWHKQPYTSYQKQQHGLCP